MILHRRGSRNLSTVVTYATRSIIEELEQRRLFVSVHGGDSFEMQDAAGNIVRIHVDGPAQAQFDLIGSTTIPDVSSPNGQSAILNDIPGQITTPTGTVIDQLGGIGGADGVEPEQVVTGASESRTDYIGGVRTLILASSGAINLANISSDSQGNTYALQRFNFNPGTGNTGFLELSQLDYTGSSDATVVDGGLMAEIIQLPAFQAFFTDPTTQATPARVQAIFGMDFLPTDDNLLYFGATVQSTIARANAVGNGTANNPVIPLLFTYDFSKPIGARIALVGEFNDSLAFGFGDTIPTINNFTFTPSDQLVFFCTGREVDDVTDPGTPAIVTQQGLVVLPKINVVSKNLSFDISDIFRVTRDGAPAAVAPPAANPSLAVRSLVAIPGDKNFIYGITGNGAQSILLHIPITGINAGSAVNFGPLPDPDDLVNTPPRGTNLGDLTWNPQVTNAFTGKKGALLAEDTTTDELVQVDSRNRFPNTNLFSIYGTNTTKDNSLSIAVVPALNPPPDPTIPFPPPPAPRKMTPFTGTAGNIQVINAQTGLLQTITPPANSGGVFIGARTRNLIANTTQEENLPIRRIKKPAGQNFGNVPADKKFIYAGITINGDAHNVLIGGTVTGNVDVYGSVDMLYAGWFVTGDAAGRLATASVSDIEGNVFIAGDCRNIVSVSAMGTNTDAANQTPVYVSGFNMVVGGKLGQVKTLDSFLGAVSVSNSFPGSGATQFEIEDRRGPVPAAGDATYFQGLVAGDAPSLGDETAANTFAAPVNTFANDTFATPQFLGTAQNSALGSDEVVVIHGSINNESNGATPAVGIQDLVDYYALPLLAGQKVTVQLSSNSPDFPAAVPANVGVFDPDGRLIASDRAKINTDAAGQAFSFTADRPGPYRFAIGYSVDPQFNGLTALGATLATSVLPLTNYTLRLTGGISDIALGGVVATTNIFTYQTGFAGFSVHNGDLGALSAGTAIFDADLLAADNTTLLTLPYDVRKGNLRSVEAPTIGFTTAAAANAPGVFNNWINLHVPKGSVGLLRATGVATTQILAVNQSLPMVDSFNVPVKSSAIGGDYQLVDARSVFAANLSAMRSLGTMRAVQMTSDPAPFFIANADLKGNDGVIDLIDITGDMGTVQGGGPHLYTGPGGNVRYIRALGNVFSSSRFGGSPDLASVLTPGTFIQLTDDSGTPIKLTPTPLVPNLAFDPTNGVLNPLLNPGQLSVRTYQVDDKVKGGGVVIMDVSIDPPGGTTTAITGNHSILFDAKGTGTGSVEIGTVHLFDNGTNRAITEVAAADLGAPTVTVPDRADDLVGSVPPTEGTPIDLSFTGDSTVDVWSIVARNKANSAFAPVDNIVNDTGGEIVNVDASSIASISGDWIGVAKSHTGADGSHSGNAVLGVTVLDDGGTAAAGAATVTTPFVQQRNLIHVRGAGYLVSVRANKGIGNIWVEGILTNLKAGSKGIMGPIVVTTGSATATTDGRIQSLDIGGGLGYSGSGNVPLTGIFASDVIQSIKGSGVGHDIRGAIHVGAAVGSANVIDGLSIPIISLKDGAMIGADIGITQNFNDWRVNSGTIVVPETQDDPNLPRFDIGSISVKGIGGIIGSFIQGPDIGPIKISGGFGMLNSVVESLSNNRVAGIDTAGYGIRGTAIASGESLTSLNARGDGTRIDANSFTPSVLQSATKKIDPNTGMAPNKYTDLYRALGISKKNSKKKSVTASGVIENVIAVGIRDLGGVSAYQIRGKNGGETAFEFNNSIGDIKVLNAVDEFEMSSGSLKHFTTGADIFHTDIAISGPVNRFDIGGTVHGTCQLRALGPEGTISTLKTKRALFGSVFSSQGIGSILVGTDLGARLVQTVQSNLDLLAVSGSILTGAFVSVDHTLHELNVGEDIQSGATVRAKVIDKQTVGGSIDGNIIIGK